MPVSGNVNNQGVSSNSSIESSDLEKEELSSTEKGAYRGRDVEARKGKNVISDTPDQSVTDEENNLVGRVKATSSNKKLLIGGASAVLAGASFNTVMLTKPEYETTVQPELGANEAEEYAIFKQLMEPYKNLPEDERQKAVLVLMQDRLREHVSYGYDQDSEGVDHYVSSPEETLADGGENIDCEDYALMCERWCGYARAEGIIPADSKTHVFSVNTPDGENPHAIFVYESNDIPPERYVIDTFTTSDEDQPTRIDEWVDKDLDSNGDDLVSLDEYLENTDFEFTHSHDLSYDPDAPGTYSYSGYVFSEQWLENSSDSSSIGSSISREALVARQQEWLDQGNSLGLPDNFQDNVEDLEYQIELIEAQQLVGKWGDDGVITADSLGLTASQREELVGKYSEQYRRPFTEEDLGVAPEASVDVDVVEEDIVVPPASASEVSHPDSIEYASTTPPPDGQTPEEFASFETDDPVPVDSAEAITSEGEAAGDVDSLKAMGFNPALYIDAAQLGAEIGASVAESALVTAFAQLKLYRLKKRRQAIDSAYKISTTREKILFKQLGMQAGWKIQDETYLPLRRLLTNDKQIVNTKKLAAIINAIDDKITADMPDLKQLKAMGIVAKKLASNHYQLNIDKDKLYDYLKTTGIEIPNLFRLAENIKPVNKKQFREYAELCFIADEQSGQGLSGPGVTVGNILKQKDCFVENENLSTLMANVVKLNTAADLADGEGLMPVPGSPLTRSDIETLDGFRKDLQNNPGAALQNKKRRVAVNDVLDRLGIHIDYRTDKWFSSKDAKVIYQQVKMEPDKLFDQLQTMQKLPSLKAVDQILEQHRETITALHTLKDYDQWKIHQHKIDRNLKLASTVVGFLPLSLGIDEVLKAAAYGREANYRRNNQSAMNERIDDTMTHLKGGTDGSRELKALLATKDQPLTRKTVDSIRQALTVLVAADDSGKGSALVKRVTAITDTGPLTSGDELLLTKAQSKKLQNALGPFGIKIVNNTIKIDDEKLGKALRKKSLNTVAEPINTDGALQKVGWKQEEVDQLTTLLENARAVKNSHMAIKTAAAGINTGIHTTAAIADPFTSMTGPLGQGIKAGVKGGAKIATAIGAAVDRRRKDKKLKNQGTFSEPREIYRFYKALYQKAVQENQSEKAASIQRLAQVTFGVTQEGFAALSKTDLVENNRFKLSFSRG